MQHAPYRLFMIAPFSLLGLSQESTLHQNLAAENDSFVVWSALNVCVCTISNWSMIFPLRNLAVETNRQVHQYSKVPHNSQSTWGFVYRSCVTKKRTRWFFFVFCILRCTQKAQYDWLSFIVPESGKSGENYIVFSLFLLQCNKIHTTYQFPAFPN